MQIFRLSSVQMKATSYRPFSTKNCEKSGLLSIDNLFAKGGCECVREYSDLLVEYVKVKEGLSIILT